MQSRTLFRWVTVVAATPAFILWACGGDHAGAGPAADASADGARGVDASLDAGLDGRLGEAGTDAAAEAAPPKPPFDWVGVIGSGQSLSVGATASFLDTTQPFGNLKLVDNGPDPKYPITPDAGAPSWATAPLTEPIRGNSNGSGPGYGDGQYPDNIAGETPHSGMANTLSALWAARGGQGSYVSAHTVVGWSGNPLTNIDKEGGMRAYPASLNEARVFHQLAAAQGKTYGVGAIVLTHGEADAGNSAYGAGLFQYWQDYSADIKAITGQTTDVVLLASQQSTIAAGYGSSAVQLWQAGVAHPGQIVCTGPKYQYAYSSDFLHLPAPGYERLGEKYAEVFDLVVNQHMAWTPLQPKKATLAGAAITVDFDVPVPPLNWDPHMAPPHGQANTAWTNGKGFEVVDASNAPVAIASADIQGSSVVLTLTSAPAPGTTLTVGYALTQDGTGTQGGMAQGLRGLLRDSDEFVGYDAEQLPVNVTMGSAVVTSTSPGAFAHRAGWDAVSGAGIASGTIVVSHDSDDQMTLSAPWTGASGMATLSLHHDEHNYCVHFAMPVQ